VYRNLAEGPHWGKALQKPRGRWKDYIKLDLTGLVPENGSWLGCSVGIRFYSIYLKVW
jgi:hypothetical protein